MPALTVEQALDLALRHYRQGRLADAESIYRQILTHQPHQARAMQMLGMLAHQQGRGGEGIALLQKAAQLDPTAADCLANLGVVLAEQGRLTEAAIALRRSLTLDASIPETHNSLGNVLKEQGQLDDAIAAYHRALDLRPGYATALYNLGSALLAAGKGEESISWLRQAIAVKPDYADAYNNLGNALNGLGQPDHAIEVFERAIALRPDYAEAHNNLASVFQDTARLAEAITHYRRSLQIKPDPRVGSNLALAVHLYPDDDPQRILDEQRRWDVQFGQPLTASFRPHGNNPDPNRRIRIGYVSPDFKSHPVGQYMVPLLEHHDHQRFEIVCYSDVARPDAITARLQSAANQWRDTSRLSDPELAERIRQDQIDILVDLSLHTRHNRLPVFAHKPAPVQITYLAYCSTSGLSTMDYRLSDPYLDPPGQDDRFYSERSIRLPGSYYCYNAPDPSPEVLPPPAGKAGHITFGSLNKYAKVTPAMLTLWARAMRHVNGSRLILHCPPGAHRQRVYTIMNEQGIEAERIEFVDSMPYEIYLQAYQRIDIALDTFPYPGATTTCDALWMGVPTVSLSGRTALSRAGLSILRQVGLGELVASTPQQYVEIIPRWAGDVEQLRRVRLGMRRRMLGSPLMNAQLLARGVEDAYRFAWRRWCDATADKGDLGQKPR